MKKLMIALGAVAMAAGVQAASITWNSTAYPALPETCALGLGNGDVRMYVWQFSSDMGYDSAAKVWNAVQNGTLKFDEALPPSTPMLSFLEKASVASGNVGDEGKQMWAAVLLLHDDNKVFVDSQGKVVADYYIANFASALASDGDAKVNNLGTALGGNGLIGDHSATSWQSVPEPTSGLLLLLGVAGLALRRRRA